MSYEKVESYCCKMRAKFLIGIVGVDNSVKIDDVDLADFVVDWSNHDKPVINIRFCPFCGQKIDYGTQPMRDII